MRTLSELAAEFSTETLDQSDIDWLHLLMSDWQVLADLSACDLVLWLPTADEGFVAVALCRSGTSTTVHMDDLVGLHAPATRAAQLLEAYETGKIVTQKDVRWSASYSAMNASIPVVHGGRSIAVLSREGNFSSLGSAGQHATWASDASDILCTMISQGAYPYASGPSVSSRGMPRVNDGVMLLSKEGVIKEATPNATSCMRRIGVGENLVGLLLAERLTEVIRESQVVDETMAVVATGKASWMVEVEGHGSTIALRALPLSVDGIRVGAVLLTRDITERARHEQELISKNATIREIHHRVKNNLQTVSALLRMQSRRSDSDEVKQALHEAGRRVEAIAAIHEALSQNVDEIVSFDEVAAPILRMAAAVASTTSFVEVETQGEFGLVPADAAAALATVLTELVTNSVEHGMQGRDGKVIVSATRSGQNLKVVVEDDGVGIEEGAAKGGLGTQIVHMMVKGELQGKIKWESPKEGGTRVTLHLNISQ